MPLVRLSQCLAALPPGAALGCFSAWNIEGLLAVMDAASALNMPLALSLDEQAKEHVGLGPLSAAAIHLARSSSLPVTVHANHCRDHDTLDDALALGIPSVMFDGSHLPLKANIAQTREAARMAHSAGAEIEGEIGALEGEALPGNAREFVQETGVDFLAVSIPKPASSEQALLDIDLLEILICAVDVPLVFHGASRLEPDDLLLAIHKGIRKINVHTELLRALGAGIQTSTELTSDPLAWLRAGREACTAKIKACLELYSPTKE